MILLGRLAQQFGYTFTTPTPATHARVNARPGNEWARSLRDVFGWSRPFKLGVVPERLLRAMTEAGAVTYKGDSWSSHVRISTLDKLHFIHSAFPTTEPHAVFFGPDTYRFVRAIKHHLNNVSVCGCECVSV